MNIKKICLTMGLLLIIMSVLGSIFRNSVIFPNTILHALGSFGFGIALFASGVSQKKVRARNAALDIGVVMFLLGIGGFTLGTHLDNDNFVIIPRALELSNYHHIINTILGTVLLISYFIEKRKSESYSRITTYLQTRKVR